MKHPVLLLAIVAFPIGLAACQNGAVRATTPVATASTRPAPAGGDDVVTTFVPFTGFVRGSREAMTDYGKPLTSTFPENAAVGRCRDAAAAEATKLGARDVEAVAAGPLRRDGQGRTVASIRMRITYIRFGGGEVRDATVTCTLDRAGNVIQTGT